MSETSRGTFAPISRIVTRLIRTRSHGLLGLYNLQQLRSLPCRSFPVARICQGPYLSCLMHGTTSTKCRREGGEWGNSVHRMRASLIALDSEFTCWALTALLGMISLSYLTYCSMPHQVFAPGNYLIHPTSNVAPAWISKKSRVLLQLLIRYRSSSFTRVFRKAFRVARWGAMQRQHLAESSIRPRGWAIGAESQK